MDVLISRVITIATPLGILDSSFRFHFSALVWLIFLLSLAFVTLSVYLSYYSLFFAYLSIYLSSLLNYHFNSCTFLILAFNYHICTVIALIHAFCLMFGLFYTNLPCHFTYTHTILAYAFWCVDCLLLLLIMCHNTNTYHEHAFCNDVWCSACHNLVIFFPLSHLA